MNMLHYISNDNKYMTDLFILCLQASICCRHVCCIVICLSSAVYKHRGKEYQAYWELLHSAVLLCTVDWEWILQSVWWAMHFFSVCNNESELI